MTAATSKGTTLPAWEVAKIWGRHLTSLVLPGLTLTFLWTGPHRWYLALLFILPLVLVTLVDSRPLYERRQPEPSLPAWPFDALVYLLAALQLVIVLETARFFSIQGVFSVDMVMVLLVVGGSSGFSIITAHELIHRRKAWERQLGRLLLCTVLYEHFYTEHLRGHHVRVGTPEDPATARFGESYQAFFRRTLPAQFRSAWRLESRRLDAAGLGHRRLLAHRILQGLLVGWGMGAAILWLFGWAAFLAFLLQAWMAVRLLESVNYFEHWGLRRRGPRVGEADSWDTHAWFTYYGLTGLSRHAGHHAWPSRPFQQLRVSDQAPLLPHGYVGMTDLVMARNDEFQRLASEELARRGLGPFAGEPGGPEAARARLAEARQEEATAGRPPRLPALRQRWRSLSTPTRWAFFLTGAWLLTSLGAHWETSGREMGIAARLALHAWIFACLGAAIVAHRWLQARLPGEALAWMLGFALLWALGVLGDALGA
jgi:alkane 1-monooxygenase